MIKYLLFAFLLFSCQNQPEVKPEPIAQEPDGGHDHHHHDHDQRAGRVIFS